MASKGWSLYLHYNNNFDRAQQLLETLQKRYPEQDFFMLKLDFRAHDEELVAAVKSLFPINAAIFAQGITDYGFLGDESLNSIDRIMQINLVTPIKLTKLLEPMLLKQKNSRIIFISSVYGVQASALESVYSASKAGLSRFAQGYAREVASNKLTVNVLAPGAVDTRMNNIFSKETLQGVREEIPASRFAGVDDITYWVDVVLDKKSDYLTGQTIVISGGWLV